MDDITFNTINAELYKIDKRYTKIYPQYKALELEQVKIFDDALVRAQAEFPSQALREAYARGTVIKWDKYEEFCKLQVEVNLLHTRMRNFAIISKNLSAANWSNS